MMRKLQAFALLIGAAVAVPAEAATTQPYSVAAFKAAQAKGVPILVEVDAWWCPVCGSQGRTIKKLTVASKYNKLVIFKLNYDKQKAEWKAFGVRKQGTIIAFKGTRETARVNFQTDKAVIESALNSTVN